MMQATTSVRTFASPQPASTLQAGLVLASASQGGFKAVRWKVAGASKSWLLYHSTLGVRVIKKKKKQELAPMMQATASVRNLASPAPEST